LTAPDELASLYEMVSATWPATLATKQRHGLLQLYDRVADAGVEDPGEGLESLLATLPLAWQERNADGVLTGIAGLGRSETAHRLVEGAPGCFGWCAWDCLFLAGVLGRRLRFETCCPTTGQLIIGNVSPADCAFETEQAPVMVFARVDAERFAGSLRSVFCAHVRLCVDLEAAQEFAAQERSRLVLDVQEAFLLGQHRNRVVLGDSLRN
jgi:hypothetical protein